LYLTVTHLKVDWISSGTVKNIVYNLATLLSIELTPLLEQEEKHSCTESEVAVKC